MFETIEIKEVKKELGLLIKAMRKQRGLSQQQLAEALDVSRTTIQNVELGKNYTIDIFLKILKEMDVLEPLLTEVNKAKAHVVNSKSMY